MQKKNDHWYHGLFYDKIIAPNQDRAYKQVKNLIKTDASVLDIGCGTGRLAFFLEDHCRKFDGIDISIRNIELALNKLNKNPSTKIHFYHNDLLSFLENSKGHYNYAVLSYVIHEIDIRDRIKVIQKISEHSDNIIIVDYLTPRPKNFWKILNEIVEFAAGKEHYRNFKTYIDGDGILGLAEKSDLKITTEIKNKPSTCHIAVLTKNTSELT
jgi:SAM-dependent methyltransferase